MFLFYTASCDILCAFGLVVIILLFTTCSVYSYKREQHSLDDALFALSFIYIATIMLGVWLCH
jgi:formate hydrogenlyase subunit 3/multisubunit Na+/H+ antiporter MnhD subunit